MDPAAADTVIAAVRSGAIERYEALIVAYQAEVWRVVAGARFDSDLAHDLVHQAFITAYRNLDRYQVGTSFPLWLKGIARNLVREELRRRRTRTKHEAIYRQLLTDRINADADDADDPQLEALRRCSEGLSQAHAELIQLRYERGLELDAIAERLGASAAAVKQKLYRARALLRRCIEQRIGAGA